MIQPSNATFISWRFYLILTAIFLCVIGIIARIVDLSFIHQAFLIKQSNDRVMRLVSTPAWRGMILDRNGYPLAVSTSIYSVWMNPKEMLAKKVSLKALAACLGVSAKELHQTILQKKEREFVYIKRGVSPAVAEKIQALRVKGVYLQKEFRRYYPEGEVTAHVVGFTNIDDKGQEGLELAYDKWLQGEQGQKWVIKDRLGRIVADVKSVSEQKPGNNLTLSVDRRLQYLAYRELMQGVKENKAESGSVVIMSAKTGEVLGMVNYPAFNPNNKPIKLNEYIRNRAVTDTFEPGSTVKAFSVASVLQNGNFDLDTLIDTSPGWIRIGRNLIKDDGKNNGLLTVAQILQKSSNVGIAKLVMTHPTDQLVTLLGKVGFGEISGIGFPGEQSGKLNHYYQPGSFSFATLAFGYGLSTTTLQLAKTFCILANHGVKIPVTLIKQHASPVGTQVINPKFADQILLLLESAVNSGTGEKARVPGFRVAGKTGTSRMVGKFGYEKNKHTALFVGIAPISDPAFVIAVVIKDPKGKNYLGGKVASPIFERIMEGTLRIMDVAPDEVTVT